jgi:hypothetical protein
MKGVVWAPIRAWIVGTTIASVGPKIGAERRAQVGNEGVEEERMWDSAMA